MALGFVRRFCGACLALGWLAQPAAARSYPVTTRWNVAYGMLGEQVGDLYSPGEVAGPRPVVVMIHGGGWVSSSRGVVGKLAEVLAGGGIAVFNIDYRLAKADQPSTRWPAQLADAQLAVRYLRAHAKEFDIDPGRIGAMGDSSGGQLAMMLGALHVIVPGDAQALYPDQRPDVSAVIDEFGPTDIPGMGPGAVENMKALFGTATPSRTVADSASPLGYITGDTAPTYILHGHVDQVVPFAQSERLDQSLQDHHVPHVFVAFDGGHGFQGVSAQDVGKLQVAAFDWLLQTLR